jgi:K+ transporter
VGSTLALAHPLYYNRLVQLASTIKFVHQILSTEDKGTGGILGLIALRTSRSSSNRSFWDSITWIRPLGASLVCIAVFL